MALALIQAGTGGALCVYASPLPDKAGVPDATTAPNMPAATLAALGPVPCVVGVNARGTESPDEIMTFAKAKTGRELWWAALVGVSRGCQRVRDLWMAGAAATALVLIDGMAGQNPPTSIQLGFAQTVTAVARSGAILLVVSHTYIEQGKAITSTAEMARTATGWALAPPPAGETVRRVQAPAGDDPQPPAWRGGLVVFSTGSGPADANAHRDQMGRLLPLILADRVRPLVDLPERPEVVASELPASSPEPEAEAGPWSHLASLPSRAPTVAPATLAPVRQSDVTWEMGTWADAVLRNRAVPMGGTATKTFGGRPALARVEWHPPSAQIDHVHRGVSLYWMAAPRAAPTPARSLTPGSAPSPAPRVMLIGDSLARGLGPPLRALAIRANVLFAWTGVDSTHVADWLGAALTNAIANASGPTMALVCLGTNDMRGNSAEAAGHRAGELIDALRRNGVPTVRWIAPPPMFFDTGDFLPALQAECSGRGVRIFDSAALRPPLERAGDKIHLTPGGYKAWAEAVARWVPFEGLGEAAPAPPPPAAAGPGKPASAPAKPAPRPVPTGGQDKLPGAPLPPPRPRAPGEGRTPLDPSETLGERAMQVSIEEQRDGVHEDPPHSNRSPRIDQYRRGIGSPGENWCGFGFCYAGYSALQPGEILPHAYSGRVAEIVRTGTFHPKGDGYAPRLGDGAIYKRGGQDPTKGGNGHIGRVTVLPDAIGRFEDIEANSGDAWAQRVHQLDEPDFLGWLEYPLGPPVEPPNDSIVVEDMGRMPLEQYVARVVTAELGESREPQALAALAMAARTYAVWFMRHEGLGTDAKPMPNATRYQVVAGAPMALAIEAAKATRSGLILYKHRPLLACHNAGAIWERGALTGAGGKDPTGTEKNITYNQGLTGKSVKPTRIASANVEGNRGCLSQHGADALASRGYVWPEILRYFYGRDVDFNIPEPAVRRPSPAPGPTPKPAAKPSGSSGGDLVFPLAAALGCRASRSLGWPSWGAWRTTALASPHRALARREAQRPRCSRSGRADRHARAWRSPHDRGCGGRLSQPPPRQGPGAFLVRAEQAQRPGDERLRVCGHARRRLQGRPEGAGAGAGDAPPERACRGRGNAGGVGRGPRAPPTGGHGRGHVQPVPRSPFPPRRREASDAARAGVPGETALVRQRRGVDGRGERPRSAKGRLGRWGRPTSSPPWRASPRPASPTRSAGLWLSRALSIRPEGATHDLRRERGAGASTLPLPPR